MTPDYRILYRTKSGKQKENIVVEDKTYEEAVESFKHNFPTYEVLL